MRLTLRTLLAYMDDILELEDAQDIAKKIQESDRASQLLHRIRDVTQRLRLAAELPEPTEGLDPNTVAEYLDNTLPAEQVLDFEKVCLESDLHLAEVASCHQILTLVLGEPAEVDPESRLRMYQVPRSESVSRLQEPEVPPAAAAPVEESALVLPREKPLVPEYLREPTHGSGWWPLWLLLALAAVVVAAAFLTHQFDPGAPLGDLLVSWWTPSAVPATAPASAVASTSAAAMTPAAAQTPAVAPAPTPPPAAVMRQPPDTEVASPPAPSPASAQAPLAPMPPSGPEPAENVMAPPTPSAVAASAPETPAALIAPPLPETAIGVPPAPEMPAAPPPETKVSQPSLQAVASPPPADTQAAPLPQEPIGQYNSASEILVRFNRDNGTWSRIPAQSPLASGELLVSLPTYRPTLTIGKGLELQLFDGGRITAPALGSDGVPTLAVAYGRLVLRLTRQSSGSASLRVQVGERTSLVRFEEPNTELRLEVRRPDPPTADPETQPAPLVTTLYVVAGKVLWQEAPDQAPQTMTAPATFQIKDGPPQALKLEKLPAWDGPEAVPPLDQQAAAVLLKACASERPTLQTLQEQAVNPSRREVRWLAMRCLGHLGDFEPMAQALDNPEQSRYWPEYVEQLQEGMARGPESAAAVRRAMEKIQGVELYELLWKYRQSPLKPPEAQQLAQYLDHQSLAVRVLTLSNLFKLYGASLGYDPKYPAAKRSLAVQKWRNRLGVNGSGRAKAAGGEGVPEPAQPAGSQF